jgi:hypothetical protein
MVQEKAVSCCTVLQATGQNTVEGSRITVSLTPLEA